jgi:hypothetical protein
MTAHDPRLRYDAEAPADDVALATSAAPTYFAAAPFPTPRDGSYVDGGVVPLSSGWMRQRQRPAPSLCRSPTGFAETV